MSLRRKVRIYHGVVERQVFDPYLNDNILSAPTYCNVGGSNFELTPIFYAEIQVKVLWFWIPIWEESCEYSDADARESLLSKVHEVYQSLTKMHEL